MRLALTVVATVIGFHAVGDARQAGGGGQQPGTTWSDARLKETVDVARVGRKLTPKAWPNGAQVAVCLSFDTDTEAPLKPGVWFATGLQIAQYVKSSTPR